MNTHENFNNAYVDKEHFATVLTKQLVETIKNNPELTDTISRSIAFFTFQMDQASSSDASDKQIYEEIRKNLVLVIASFFPRCFMHDPDLINPYVEMIERAKTGGKKF